MQRLEVIGAVRLIYRSLGVKGLKFQVVLSPVRLAPGRSKTGTCERDLKAFNSFAGIGMRQEDYSEDSKERGAREMLMTMAAVNFRCP